MPKNNSLEQIIKNSSKAIIIGIGGGGDIVGTIPTYDLLRMFGIKCFFAGLPWERSVVDPVPGPRSFEEIRNARKLNEVVWYANKDTITNTGIRFAETGFSQVLDQETLLIGLDGGPETIAEGILDAAEKLKVDLVVGIDVGGDFLAQGDEPGLMSPLADSIMTAAIARIDARIPTMMGLFGFGSDGELSPEELEHSIKVLAKEEGLLGSWGMTREALSLMEDIVSIVPTEASRVPVRYAKEGLTEVIIRSGRRTVKSSVSSTVTYYFSTSVIYEKLSKLARILSNSKSFQEAHEVLHSVGVRTEIDLEIEKLKGVIS